MVPSFLDWIWGKLSRFLGLFRQNKDLLERHKAREAQAALVESIRQEFLKAQSEGGASEELKERLREESRKLIRMYADYYSK